MSNTLPNISRLPKGWRIPTPETVAQYVHGISHGLVPASHEALSLPAETVPTDEAAGLQTRRILRRMYGVLQAMEAAGRRPMGMTAPQIGEQYRIALVPWHPDYDDDTYGPYMPIINPHIEADIAATWAVWPHGCFSSNEVYARVWAPSSHVLHGLDHHGEPLRAKGADYPGVPRSGLEAVVDTHEVWHLEGIRAADIAVQHGHQLDWRPPELAKAYGEHMNALLQGADVPEWDRPYAHSQWQTVKLGTFALSRYA